MDTSQCVLFTRQDYLQNNHPQLRSKYLSCLFSRAVPLCIIYLCINGENQNGSNKMFLFYLMWASYWLLGAYTQNPTSINQNHLTSKINKWELVIWTMFILSNLHMQNRGGGAMCDWTTVWLVTSLKHSSDLHFSLKNSNSNSWLIIPLKFLYMT